MERPESSGRRLTEAEIKGGDTERERFSCCRHGCAASGSLVWAWIKGWAPARSNGLLSSDGMVGAEWEREMGVCTMFCTGAECGR